MTGLVLMGLAACGGDDKKATGACDGAADCGGGVCFEQACYDACGSTADCGDSEFCVVRQGAQGDVTICVVAAAHAGCQDDAGCADVKVGACEAVSCDPAVGVCRVDALTGPGCEGTSDTVQPDAVEPDVVDETVAPDTAPVDTVADSADTGQPGLAYDEEGWARVVPDDGAKWTYRSQGVDLATRFVASDSTLGQALGLFEAMGQDGDKTVGVRLWGDLSTPWRAVVHGADLFQNADSADVPTFTQRFEPAVALELDLEVGVKRTVTFKTKQGFPAGGDTYEMDIELEYELLARDETVEVPYGSVEGCFHYNALSKVTDEFGGFNLPVEIWYHPDLGLVKIDEIIGIMDVQLVKVGE